MEIYSQEINETLTGSSDGDIIKNSGALVKIYANAGDDFIKNEGYAATIDGGKGNDIISIGDIKHNVIKYASGDGNDTVFGFDSDDTLHITKGSYSTIKSGNDFIVKVGNSKITLKDALADNYNKITIKNSRGKISTYNDWKVRSGSVVNTYAENVTLAGSKSADYISNHGEKVLIKGDAGNDYLENNVHYVTITGDAGNDYIENWGDNVSISGGADKDIIRNHGDNITIDSGAGDDRVLSLGSYVTISSGAGNDTVSNYYHNVKIDGGSGNDSINTSDGNDVTITGGKGNDIISIYNNYAENVLIQYASGDGNDTIRGTYSDYILHITKGSYKTSVSGSDVVVTVGNGKITLKDAVGKDISIKNSSGKVTTQKYSNITELFAKDNLSEIVSDKFAMVEFENYKSDYKQENLITFADK